MVIRPANDDCAISSHAIAQLLEEAKPATDVDGFDAEWKVWTSGARPIATVQLATGVGTTIIFHVKYGPGGRKQVFPRALRAVLEKEDILKVRACRMAPATLCPWPTWSFLFLFALFGFSVFVENSFVEKRLFFTPLTMVLFLFMQDSRACNVELT